MAFSPTVLCNNILKRSFSENIPVTPMKLQKLLYFVSCEYLKCTNTPLLSESFEVWQYGPVLPSVYNEFKSFRSSPITTFAKDANGGSFAYQEDTAPNLKNALDAVWSCFKERTGVQLSRITHEDGSGWSNAFQNRENTISEERMKADTTYEKYMSNSKS